MSCKQSPEYIVDVDPAKVPVVMIADDDDGIRETLTRFLKMSGYLVLVASDGLEAVSLFNSKKDIIDICLIDLNMPELDGASCVRQIRECSVATPILLMTGEDEEFDLPESLNDEIEMRFTKPFDWGILLERISEILAIQKSCTQ